jgi:hypothetical protein
VTLGRSQTSETVGTQHASDTVSQPQQAMSHGIIELRGIEGELEAFVYRGADAPNWTNLVTRFKATLDQMTQAGQELGWPPGGR